MRIEFKTTFFLRTYYEFEGVSERIRYSGDFYWNFDGWTYRTCASNNSKIYRNDKIIASCKTNRAPTWRRSFQWDIVDTEERHWQIVEAQEGCWVDWKTIDGKRIMAFRHQWSRGTAVIRSDWSENVGLLVGLVVPVILSSG